MTYETKRWLHKVGSAFIGGAATGASVLFSSSLFEGHIDWKVAGSAALVSGVGHALLYLKQFPLPEWDGFDRRGDVEAALPEALPTAQVAKEPV